VFAVAPVNRRTGQAQGYLRRLGEKRKIVAALGNNAANLQMPHL
jgi:hypothetical protein